MSRKKELKNSSSDIAVGNRLRILRCDHLNVRSRREFARRLGVPHTTIANYERGVCGIPKALIEKMVATFRVNPRWLFHGIGEPLLSNPKIEAMSGAECAGDLLAEIWDELDETKAKLAEYERGKPPAVQVKETEEPAPYTTKDEKQPAWKIAAVKVDGKRITIKKPSDVKGPVNMYDGDDVEGWLRNIH